MEFVYAQSEMHSIDWIIDKIKTLSRVGVDLGDIAILYRIKFHNIKIDQALTRSHIPHSILGAFRLIERSEIRHFMCYMKLIYSNDSISLESIINVPKRGMGKMAISKMYELAKEMNLSFYDAVFQAVKGFKNVSSKTEQIVKFAQQIQELKKLKDETNVKFVTQRILKITNYLEHWPAEERETRESNIYKFIEEDIQSICINHQKTIKEAIENIGLLSSGDQKSKYKKSKVILSTIHQAKGLEFKYVFVINMNKGQIPYFKVNGVGSKQEERRIAYVAITRAKLKLFLCSFARPLFDEDPNTQQPNQSEYITELLGWLKKVTIDTPPNFRPNQNFKKFCNW